MLDTGGGHRCIHGGMRLTCPECSRHVAKTLPALPEPTAPGCICPPGANLTCRAPLCPRGGLPGMS